MSLQVCHCGWSRVTTHHGLRIHQGRKGCTLKGVKLEPQQQYMWDYAGLTNVQMEVKLDVRTSVKSETKDCYSDLSLQVCHCGWTKMTTFQGLRIHQGKGGCTSRGIKIPKKEQYDWKHLQEEDHMKYRPERRVIVKEEKSSGPPRMRSSCAATTARIKEERQSPLPLASHRPKSTFSTLPQVNRTTKEPPVPANQGTVVQAGKKKIPRQEKTDSCYDLAATAARIKKEPKSPFAASELSLGRAATLKSYEQLQDVSSDVQARRSYRETPTTPAARPKERNRRDQRPSQVRGLVGELPPVTDQYAAVQPKKREEDPEPSQVDSSARRHPSTPPLVPKKNDKRSEFQLLREIQNYSQRKNKIRKEEVYSSLPEKKRAWEVNTSAREHPSTAPVVPPENKNSLLCTAEQELPASLPVVPFKKSDSSPFKWKQQRSESPLVHQAHNYFQRESKTSEEQSGDVEAAETACESVKRTNKPTAAQQEKHPSFSCEDAGPDVSTGMKVKELAQMFSVQETASPPKKEDGEEHELSEDDPASPIFRSPTTAPVMEENTSPFTQENSTKAGHPLEDFSAAEKVNTSAREHPSTPPVVPPKNKNSLLCTAEQELPASLPVVPFKKSDSSPFKWKQQRSESPLVHQAHNYFQRESKMPEEQSGDVEAAETACESVKRTNKPTAAQQEEHPSFSCEDAGPDVSTGMKVKELAQIFSVQETASPPKKEDGEEHELSESVTSTRSTNTQTASAEEEVPQMEDPSSVCRSSQPDFSAGMKVKELALKFSVHKAAARSVVGHREQRKVSQPNVLTQEFLPTASWETVIQPKNNGEEKLMLPDSANAATKVNRVSAKATEEGLKSSCETKPYPGFFNRLRVKDLARMFSANTVQEKSVGPKDKLGEGKPAHMVKLIVQKLSATTSHDTVHPKQKVDVTFDPKSAPRF